MRIRPFGSTRTWPSLATRPNPCGKSATCCFALCISGSPLRSRGTTPCRDCGDRGRTGATAEAVRPGTIWSLSAPGLIDLFLIAPVAGVAVSVVNARCDSRGHRSGGGRGGALSGCPGACFAGGGTSGAAAQAVGPGAVGTLGAPRLVDLLLVTPITCRAIRVVDASASATALRGGSRHWSSGPRSCGASCAGSTCCGACPCRGGGGTSSSSCGCSGCLAGGCATRAASGTQQADQGVSLRKFVQIQRPHHGTCETAALGEAQLGTNRVHIIEAYPLTVGHHVVTNPDWVVCFRCSARDPVSDLVVSTKALFACAGPLCTCSIRGRVDATVAIGFQLPAATIGGDAHGHLGGWGSLLKPKIDGPGDAQGVACQSFILRGGVERRHAASAIFPGAVEVVGHQIHQIQVLAHARDIIGGLRCGLANAHRSGQQQGLTGLVLGELFLQNPQHVDIIRIILRCFR
mmetsp:Transcript_41311/g.89504  ORF Transcript_41311/g.89504 Transcript_41311/m.89504 type:complete len:461 (-) Transcript_41311:787-2169(-)